METTAVCIRRLSVHDFEAVKQMHTGIEEDYVLHIFPESVHNEVTYGAFVEDQLVSMAAFTVFAGRYAVLGRLRTDLRFRGRGLVTQLLEELCGKIDDDLNLAWVGLATRADNFPVHQIAAKLQMNRLSTFYSCTLNEAGQTVLHKELPAHFNEWTEVTDHAQKQTLLNNLLIQDKQLNVFVYECYYPLPFESPLWSEEYLQNCKCLKNNERFVLLMPDEKGSSYLHMKYFWDDSFSQPGLWQAALTEANKTGRKLWIDLPETQNFEQTTAPFERAAWMCFGRRSPAEGSVNS